MLNIKKINCIAVDDEPPALQILEKYITAIPSLHLAATCNNAVDALTVLQNEKIDLLFLDIQMPNILGTDFIRTLINPLGQHNETYWKQEFAGFYTWLMKDITL